MTRQELLNAFGMSACKRTITRSLAMLVLAGPMITPAQAQTSAAQAAALFKTTWAPAIDAALKVGSTVATFVTLNQATIEADAKLGGCLAANFAVGKLFAYAVDGSVPTPFDVCGATASGAGYYLMGQNGPGGAMPFNKFTAYVPMRSMGCSAREYNFTFSVTGPNSFTTYANEGAALVDRRNAAFAPGSAMDIYNRAQGSTAAAAAWKALYPILGDFALLAAVNSMNGGTYLYVMVSDTTKMGKALNTGVDAVANNRTYQTAIAEAKKIMSLVNGRVPAETVLIGNNITDHFALNCNYPLIFWYIAGTGNVLLN